MAEHSEIPLIRQRYQDVLGARLTPAYRSYLSRQARGASAAALGYRRAGAEPLFLERYLDQPVEAEVSAAFGQRVAREAIVEIGNFAADNAMAMIALWGDAANDLGGSSEVAVATLTAPLRRMFARIGLPLKVLGPALASRLGEEAAEWGHYYELDPMVCAGIISEGQQAINAFLQRRQRQEAA